MILEFLEKCKNQRISVLTTGNIEISGILRGYDSFANLLLDDVIETTILPSGNKTTNVDKIFLISIRIAMITCDQVPPYQAVG
jgi:small nuclear ribonucleoprotein (snRNP)-like protein